MRLALFWNYDENESEYFIQLVHLGRTSFQPLKNKIRARLKELKAARENLAKRFQQNSIQDSEAQALYYSSWIPSALHVMVDIQNLRTLESISKYLGLPTDVVKKQLEALERLGLVKREDGRWHPGGKNIHLPKASPFTAINHKNWRDRAHINAQRPEQDGLHYTAIQTLRLQDFELIKDLLLKFIEQQRKIVGPSESEELACFTCDWFRI